MSACRIARVSAHPSRGVNAFCLGSTEISGEKRFAKARCMSLVMKLETVIGRYSGGVRSSGAFGMYEVRLFRFCSGSASATSHKLNIRSNRARAVGIALSCLRVIRSGPAASFDMPFSIVSISYTVIGLTRFHLVSLSLGTASRRSGTDGVSVPDLAKNIPCQEFRYLTRPKTFHARRNPRVLQPALVSWQYQLNRLVSVRA